MNRSRRNLVTRNRKIRNDLSGLHTDAVLMRLGDFIKSLDEQHPDKDRLLEIREDVPEPGVFAVRLVPQVPDKRDEAKNLKQLLEGESQNLGDEIKEE